MTYCITERSLFTHKNVIRKILASILRFLKCMAKKIFSLVILIQLHFRINAHYVFYKIKITERNARFKRINGNTSVRAQNIIHMKFANPFCRFFLEFGGVRRKISVFIAEKFVAYFACKKNADVRLLVDCLTDKVHSHTCADCSNVERTKRADNVLKRRKYVLFCNDNFVVV